MIERRDEPDMANRLTLNLEGKAGIITGAGGGMGREIAGRLACDGAGVLLVDLNYESLCESCDEIKEKGGRAVAVQADVGVEDDVKRMTDTCLGSYSKIDFLVSNAGIVGPYGFEDTSADEWDRVFAVNTKGGFLCAKHALPHMRQNKSGRIVFNASTNGAKPGEHVIAYRASKAALIMLARSLALHVAPFGITVNAICPGVAMTSLHKSLTESLLKTEGISYEEFVAERKKRVPMGRFTDVQDVADLTEFLLSDNAGFITGQAIFVNGGEW